MLIDLPFAPRAFRDIDAWRESEAALGGDVRYIAQLALADRLGPVGYISGYCWICRHRTDFAFASGEDSPMPDWREQLACSGCGLIARARLGLLLAMTHLKHIGRGAVPYITEQVTPLFLRLKAMFPATIGSEFVGDVENKKRLDAYLSEISRGSQNEVRHEDVTALGIAPESVDAVLCFEVLEHVPRYRAALSEFRRVLRPGGLLVISVPFMPASAENLVRAERLADGTIRHLREPEYHGDPVVETGCLAYYSFGWQLLDEVRAAGFAEAGLVDAWSPASGFLGEMGMIVARRS